MHPISTVNIRFCAVLKVHYVMRGEEILIRREKILIDKVFFFMTEQTEETLEDNTVSFCMILFIFGGPCHLSSFKQCSVDLLFL